MKYKKLTKEQIKITLDRLTRFKYTETKYLRVFTDILTSCMIEPAFKKSDLNKIDYSKIAEIVSDIINYSVNSDRNEDLNINNFIKNYENHIFKNNENTQKLLNNTINYKKAIEYIDNYDKSNLRWLKKITEIKEYNETVNINLREKYALKYPLEKVIIAEGITEEILLPAFSKFMGKDFYKEGIQIIAAGGKNQVVKLFYELSEEINLPIFILLDKDAEENINQIRPKLRDIDKIHLVSCGEFEDLLPKHLIVKTVNSHFKNFLNISEDDLNQNLRMAKILEELFKTKGLHEFKKADFAKLVRENINEQFDISNEIRSIVQEIYAK